MKKTRLQCNDFWGYPIPAPHKTGAGVSVPELHRAKTDAPASFLSSASMHAKIMVGWMGEPQGSPGSLCSGNANSIQFTTLEISVSGGELTTQCTEIASMATAPTLALPFAANNPDLQIVDGKVLTTSLAIAAYFDKRHDDVLKKIRLLECTDEYRLRNFAEAVFTRKNPSGGAEISTPMYKITRDGFAFLAMGFTGKKAAHFKEDYINAFSKMEERLRSPAANAIRTRILMTLEGESISKITPVPFTSFVADCDSLAEIFPNLSHRIKPADLVRISQACMNQLAHLAGK